jgi:hypothetical protein
MFDSMAELGKLSQGKPTVIPPELIAAIAIDRIRDLEKERRSNDAVDELERLYEL